MEKSLKSFRINSNTLKIIAMFTMLLDHMCHTIVPGNEWMSMIGRIAFPIFAFQLVEGYFHTSDLRKYKKRLWIFALISETPFNLMVSDIFIWPFQQNVIFTLLIGIYIIEFLERAKANDGWKKKVLYFVVAVLLFSLSFISGVDYGEHGVLVILIFYFFRNIKQLQLVTMLIMFLFFYKGRYIDINGFELQTQALCVFALPFIWLYDEKLENKQNAIRKIGYWFYPVHMLVLYLVRYFIC